VETVKAGAIQMFTRKRGYLVTIDRFPWCGGIQNVKS